MKKILVINAGSSSMKWSLFNKNNLSEIANGLCERIHIDGNLKMNFNDKKIEKEASLNNHEDAVQEILSLWKENKVIEDLKEIESVGFRVVNGGPKINSSVVVDDAIINEIENASIFAPLHNPGALQAIRAFKKILPNVNQTANFDTAFHASIPKVNKIYPIDLKLTEELKIQKYGAHGISHRFITEKLSEILNKRIVNFVNLHLGNGASLCAVKDSKSYDTSMGLTPLSGIMMGTRSGDIDPSIHQFVMKQKGYTIDEFTNILNRKSGLLGVSQVSSDFRDVEEKAKAGDENALFAIELYVHKTADYVANYANKIGHKVDALVFTAGIGENSGFIRSKIIENLYFKNIVLDQAKNGLHPKEIGEYLLISKPESEIPVYIIRTNEEFIIARDAIKLTS